MRKRERLRIERSEREPSMEPCGNVYVPNRQRFDLRVTLERRDGGKVQFTLHHIYGRLIGQSVNIKPKQFGRRLGEIFELWMKP